jgi:hypothetical protein
MNNESYINYYLYLKFLKFWMIAIEKYQANTQLNQGNLIKKKISK